MKFPFYPLLLGIILTGAIATSFVFGPIPEKEDVKPNFLFIFSDDQRTP